MNHAFWAAVNATMAAFLFFTPLTSIAFGVVWALVAATWFFVAWQERDA